MTKTNFRRRRQLGLLAGLGLALPFGIWAVGCGSSDNGGGGSSTAGSGGSDSGGGGDSSSVGGVPPGGSSTGGTPSSAGAGPGGASAGGSPVGGGGGGGGSGGSSSTVDDSFTTDVVVEVDDDVNTILNVSWTQAVAADMVQLEFTFPDGDVMRSRARPGAAGAHTDTVLGVPGSTDVTVRIVSIQGSVEVVSSDYQGTTGPIPAGFPAFEVTDYNPALASSDRYLFGSVEDSTGGGPGGYYLNTFWLYIMDRQGRIVWYFGEPGSRATPAFQRIAKDGEYIWIEQRCFGCTFTEAVIKTTLDPDVYFEEIEVPMLSDCIDVTDDGSLLYDTFDLNTFTYPGLMELAPNSAQPRLVWDCEDYFSTIDPGFICYSNTVNWNAADDSVLLSFPEELTIIQIDRQTGDVIGQYGEAPGSYDFAPPIAPLTPPATTWNFGFQHFANINEDDNLMISSHMPGFEETTDPVANQHAFIEFSIDRQNQLLTEVWRYTDGPEWPRAKGMAIRLPNGNTLANYGTGGVIREITPDKQTAFRVKFDVATADGGDNADFYNKMVGNNVLIDDLYALNGGGPQ